MFKNKNEIKDVIKVMKSLENRGMLLKGNIEKVGSKTKEDSLFY